jgi:trimeric autotransporter adhesin
VNKPFTGSACIHERAPRENVFPRTIRDLRRALALLRPTTTLAGALLLFTPLAVSAQSSAARQQVTDRVDITRLSTLSGNRHPLARAQYDQGAAPPDLPMDRILLVLKRGPDQESALQDLLAQQQVTSSPTYHKWLTPEQFGQQFGPTDADIQAVTSWLASFGFQSIKVSKGRTVIEFSGTAAQVETALHAPIHQYVVNGESHWASSSDPQIPAALAPVISGIVSLHNFRAKHALRMSGRTVAATVTPGAKPQINLTNSQNQMLHALVPGDFNTIYNIAPSMTGNGATIGVIADSNINVQDIADFRNMFGLPVNNPQIILNGPDPGDVPMSPGELEAILDATWAGSVAPNATVDLVVSEDTNAISGGDLSELYIIDNNLADVMTESFSGCERNFSSNANFYFNVAEQAAAQGITYLVASGDGGPDGCDDQSTIPAMDTPASVNILASTPFTVAVGGTQFNDTSSPSTYWNAANAADGASAKSYIPENTWNESCTVLSATCQAIGLWSSGGGQSTSVLYSKPPWQSGVVGIPPANVRFLPDVAMNAADHDGYLLCIDGSCHGSSVTFAIASGTSASVQAFGGVMALVVQKMGGARQGIANYALYKLAAGETLSSCNGSSTTNLPISTCIFNDTTSGNTNIPGETGFTAGVGYDETTGLGSVNVTNLVNQWSTAFVGGSKTTLTLNGGKPVNVTHGTQVSVNVVVTPVVPATGTPTGDVSLIANSLTGQGADFFTLALGAANWSTTFLPGGTYPVKAHYQGDGTLTGSDSAAVTVTVNPETSMTGLGIVVSTQGCTTATSMTYGSPYILSAAVIDSKGTMNVCLPGATAAFPTGTVTLTDKFNNVTSPLDGGSFKLNSYGYFEDQTIQLPAGIHNITAVYAGDNSFLTSTSPTDVVTVRQAGTTTSLAASQTTVATGTPVTLMATVVTQSNATANSQQEPTGSVQFFVAGAAFGNPVAVSGGVNSSTHFAQATGSISPTLANGQNAITAKYLGDSNYAASAAVSNTVMVTVGSAGINLAPTSNTATINVPALGTPGTQVITVTAAGGFTGSVTLTCAVTTAMTGVSDMPTCSFTSTPTITLTSSTTSGQDTLDFNTTAASSIAAPASRRHGPDPNGLLIGEFCAVLASMFLLGLTVKKRRGAFLLATAILAVVLIGTSCGSSGVSTGGGNPGTTAGAYTVTVTATPSSGAAQSTAIAVNVP